MLILAMNPAAVEMMIPPALVNATAGAAIEFLAGRSLGHISVTTLVLEVLKSMSLLRYAKAATVLIAVMATVSAGIVLGQKPGDEAGTAKPVIPARCPDFHGQGRQVPGHDHRTGHAESGKTLNVVNEVEGTRKILSIVPEGSRVQKGDKVCELDASDLRQTMMSQRIATRKAEESLRDAEEAHLAAELARKVYAEGAYPLEVKTLENAISTTDAAIKQAEARLERTRAAIARLEHVSSSHATDVLAGLDLTDRLDKVELDLLREKATRDEARGKLDLLTRFTRERVETGLKVAIMKAKSVEQARREDLGQEQRNMGRIGSQIAACTLTAPIDGMLVYANDKDAAGRRDGFMIEEGANVRERQLLFSVIDLDGPMRVNAKIHEWMVDRLKAGQAARITFDALPGQEMTGVVKVINPIPDASSAGNAVKLYTAYVEINERSRKLRPGMSALVRIVLSDSDNAITVPLSAVTRRGEKFVVAVKTPENGFEAREVEVGAEDSTRVEIKQGLREGEIVADDAKILLPPPPGDVK